jgi:plastocyanin
MQFKSMALVASAFVFAACGGGESAPADTAATPAADAAAPAGPATAAPITGTIHTVNMIQDAQGYRFNPANLTIKAGDGVKFIAVSGFPHNVVIDATGLTPTVKAQLDANFEVAGKQEGMELTSKMFVAANEGITISFANVPAGTYNINCTPHLAMNMKGVITVQ